MCAGHRNCVCVYIFVNDTQSDLCFEKIILLHFEMGPLRGDCPFWIALLVSK